MEQSIIIEPATNTAIFRTYEDFLQRPDKTVNGVSPDFFRQYDYGAPLHHDPIKFRNSGCWNCLRCRKCTDCEECVACADCSNSKYLQDSWHCYDSTYLIASKLCSNCHYCANLDLCQDKEYFYSLSHSDEPFRVGDIPILPNIHRAVLDAVRRNTLNMSDWHRCETTHCRAGWVVQLAKAKALEDMTDCQYAAMVIYSRSSKIPVAPRQFFVRDLFAREDIMRCAEAEHDMDKAAYENLAALAADAQEIKQTPGY